MNVQSAARRYLELTPILSDSYSPAGAAAESPSWRRLIRYELESLYVEGVLKHALRKGIPGVPLQQFRELQGEVLTAQHVAQIALGNFTGYDLMSDAHGWRPPSE